MAIKYVPTTKDTSTDIDKPTEVEISDGEYMLYDLLNKLINTLKKKQRG